MMLSGASKFKTTKKGLWLSNAEVTQDVQNLKTAAAYEQGNGMLI
jgi:hypothetical protein